MQQDQPARRLAQVLHPRHRFLAAVAALVQVDGHADQADLVGDRAVVGLEAQPRLAAFDPVRGRGPGPDRLGAGGEQVAGHAGQVGAGYDEVVAALGGAATKPPPLRASALPGSGAGLAGRAQHVRRRSGRTRTARRNRR